MAELELFVTPGGEIRAVYSEAAAEVLSGLGECSTRRASSVELGPDNCWYADLGPIGGPVLGPFDFPKRADAIAAEVAWINENYLAKEIN